MDVEGGDGANRRVSSGPIRFQSPCARAPLFFNNGNREQREAESHLFSKETMGRQAAASLLMSMEVGARDCRTKKGKRGQEQTFVEREEGPRLASAIAHLV